MSLAWLAASVLVVLALGYRWYGRFIAAQYALDPAASTPATRINDGVDFVPTGRFYLLGQHFSAIAAAGPIAGPILAVQQFGWLPAILWITFGVVFIGAVHDLSTLIASVRHEGKSIAEVVKANLGPSAGLAMLVFIWVALIYVIVAFTDVTASLFARGNPSVPAGTETFHPGGAVAMASTLYLGLSILMGLVERYLKPPLWLQTAVFVPLTLVAVWAGTQLSTVFILSPLQWGTLILGYCFIASLTPVWSLLQPRGYLGGFVLYLALAIGVVGLFFGGFTIEQPAFKGFELPGPNGLLFPFLFVTIACGACSGFHGLVCSGTTSKQLRNETDAHPVGFGAMLLEGFVAIIALGTAMVVSQSGLTGKDPGAIYSAGLGRFLTVVIGEQHLPLAVTFGAMAFSTFVFDTLDVSTRLGRYILQEVSSLRFRGAAQVATAVTCAVPLFFLHLAGSGGYKAFWALFGTSNQLLASLSLLGISVWLKKSGKRFWYTLWPMLFVGAVTTSSLVLQIHSAFSLPDASLVVRLNGGVCVVLLGLAGSLFWVGGRALLAPAPAAGHPRAA